MQLLSLFLVFMKIGAFTFGGGYSMIPLIQREITEKRRWITEEELLEIIAIAESTPGPIAVNAATFVGRKVAGVWGAAAATLGVVLPSFLIISALSLVLDRFQRVRWVQLAFHGIRAGVLALILKALVMMFRQNPKGLFAYSVMIAALLLTMFAPIPLPLVLLGCAGAGLLAALWRDRRAGT